MRNQPLNAVRLQTSVTVCQVLVMAWCSNIICVGLAPFFREFAGKQNSDAPRRGAWPCKATLAACDPPVAIGDWLHPTTLWASCGDGSFCRELVSCEALVVICHCQVENNQLRPWEKYYMPGKHIVWVTTSPYQRCVPTLTGCEPGDAPDV